MERFMQSLEVRRFLSAAPGTPGTHVTITNYRDKDQLVIVADNGKSVTIPMLNDNGMPNVFQIGTYNADGTFDVHVRPLKDSENVGNVLDINDAAMSYDGTTGVTCGFAPGQTVAEGDAALRASWAKSPDSNLPENSGVPTTTPATPESQDHVLYDASATAGSTPAAMRTSAASTTATGDDPSATTSQHSAHWRQARAKKLARRAAKLAARAARLAKHARHLAHVHHVKAKAARSSG